MAAARVLIVGGGIGGLASLAYALVHTGSPETWLAPDGLEAYRGVWRRAQRATR